MTTATVGANPGAIDVANPLPTFRDPEREASFRELGYATMPLLPPDVVAEVRARYRELRPTDDSGLAIDYIRTDRSYMRAVRTLTEPLWDRYLPDLFVDHRCAFTTFVTKHPDDRSDMFLHEDRSFVDERATRAGTLWIPLVDVGPDLPNGGLQLVPGSVALANVFSGSNTPELFRPYEGALREHLVTLSLRAGEAVFYDTRTLHASPPNRSDQAREAIACAVVRRDAELVHVVASGRRHRRLYHVGADFFVESHPREIEVAMPASARLVEEWDEDPDLPDALVERLVGSPCAPEVVVPSEAGTTVRSGTVARMAPPAGYRPRTVDLEWGAGDLLPPDQVPTRHRYEVLAGSVGVLPVDRSAVGTGDVAGLTGDDGGVVPRHRSALESDVVVLDPFARLHVGVGPSRGLGAVLDVVDGPRLGAGIAGDGPPMALDLGVAASLPAGAEVVLWNDGPTPITLCLSMVPTGSPVVARAAGRLLSSWGPRRRLVQDRRRLAGTWRRP